MSEYLQLDDKIPINIFCGPENKGSVAASKIQCDHIGGLVYNGYNNNKMNNSHRVICNRCNKRFGTDVTTYNLLEYQQKLKKVALNWFGK